MKFIGFARVFSGALKRGMKVYVIGPKSQNNNINNVQEVQINNLYILMAQYLEGVKEVGLHLKL